MARYLHKSWQDKRPGFTRRVRWYLPARAGQDIRLCFEDTTGRVNRYYTTAAKAKAEYDAFRNGNVTVADFLEV